MENNKEVYIHYTNYRGKTAWRCILPIRLEFGSNEFHPEEQWFIYATDLEKNAQRTFAIKDILKWETDKKYCYEN